MLDSGDLKFDNFGLIPAVVQDDQSFYELMVLIDTIRVGRVRESRIAVEELDKRLTNG